MSLTNITIGANTYVAYASVAEADAYLAVDPNRGTNWGTLDNDQKGQFLVSATRRLDLLDWEGEKTGGEGVQEEQWPRTGVAYDDGTPVSTTEVPIELENSCILTAGSIALDPKAAEQGTSGSNTKEVKAGSASVTFFRPTEGVAFQDTTAYSLITEFLDGSNSSNTGMAASGTGDSSNFGECNDDRDKWGLTRGYS